jgi:hypothetical protein
MMGNLGGLIATWSYLLRHAPRYNIATGLNIATLSTVVLTLSLLGLWMRRDNRKRDAKQTAAEEARGGLNVSGKQDLDNKHLLFKTPELSVRSPRMLAEGSRHKLIWMLMLITTKSFLILRQGNEKSFEIHCCTIHAVGDV